MQFILFISGVGVLLFAMQQLESALANLGSEQLKHSLKSFTKSPIHGIILGIIATSILQSSSVVALMTMAFVGAGVIKLKNAIGIIFGSNFGTTFTGWIVTLLGFQLNLIDFYIPFIGLGAFGMVLIKPSNKNRNLFQLAFAFGFLLLGLELMKTSVVFVVDFVDIASLQNYPLFFFFIFGALLTAIIQSSSATMIITLSAINAGIIELPTAAALIIGADLGTTSTVIIGSIKGSIIKRQVAMVHFIFNMVVDITAFLCLPILLFLVNNFFNISDPLYGLVAIHSSFNFLGVCLFFPFIERLQIFVEKRFPEPKTHVLLINNVSIEVPEVALQALEKDTQNLLCSTILHNAQRLNVFSEQGSKNISVNMYDIDFHYNQLKLQENQLSNYILDFQRQALALEQSTRTQQLMVCIRDSLYATKAIKDIYHDLNAFEINPDSYIKTLLSPLLNNTKDIYQEVLKALKKPESFSIDKLVSLIQMIKTAHTACNAEIYELIDNKHLPKEQASTALNINREILLSCHSLVNSLENYLLPTEQAKTVSEMLNMRF